MLWLIDQLGNSFGQRATIGNRLDRVKLNILLGLQVNYSLISFIYRGHTKAEWYNIGKAKEMRKNLWGFVLHVIAIYKNISLIKIL